MPSFWQFSVKPSAKIDSLHHCRPWSIGYDTDRQSIMANPTVSGEIRGRVSLHAQQPCALHLNIDKKAAASAPIQWTHQINIHLFFFPPSSLLRAAFIGGTFIAVITAILAMRAQPMAARTRRSIRMVMRRDTQKNDSLLEPVYSRQPLAGR